MVILEMLAPGTRAVDFGGKLDGYFRLASVRHYLIVKVATRSLIHHWRGKDDGLHTALVASDAALHLDPPGLALEVPDFFADRTAVARRHAHRRRSRSTRNDALPTSGPRSAPWSRCVAPVYLHHVVGKGWT